MRARGRRAPAGLSQVDHGLVPDLAEEGVPGEAIGVLVQSVRIGGLEDLEEPGVEEALTIGWHALVRDVVSERVLERVLLLDRALLHEELGGLKITEVPA